MSIFIQGRDEGTYDSDVTQHHVHHITRWYAKKNPQGASDWAVLMDGALTQPFIATSGNGAYGSDPGDEAQLFGSTDTLWDSGFLFGDFDEFLVIANTSNTVYLLRLVWGTSGQSLADAVAAGTYSTSPFFRGAADNTRVKFRIYTPRIGIDSKIWLQCQNATDNATISFFVGVRGYYIS